MSEADTSGGWPEPRADSPSGPSPKEMAAGAAETIKQETASFMEGARERAVDTLSEHQETASQTLGDFANAIRKAGDALAQTDQSMAGRAVREAADGLERFARSVADKRPEELLEAVRDFGRRNPTAFIAGSVLAGVALGRFLKSSAPAEPTPASPSIQGSSARGMSCPSGLGSTQGAEAGAPGATAGDAVRMADTPEAAAGEDGAPGVLAGPGLAEGR